MHCRDFLENLHAGVDGELDQGAAEEFRAHALLCAPCREQSDAVKRIKVAISQKAGKVPVPEGLEARVLQSLRQTERETDRAPDPLVGAAQQTSVKNSRAAWKSFSRRLVRIAAMLLFVVVGAVLFIQMRPFGTSPKIAHGEMIESAYNACSFEYDGTPAELLCDLDPYLRDAFNVVSDSKAFLANQLVIRSWRKVTFGRAKIAAVKLLCGYKRRQTKLNVTERARRGNGTKRQIFKGPRILIPDGEYPLKRCFLGQHKILGKVRRVADLFHIQGNGRVHDPVGNGRQGQDLKALDIFAGNQNRTVV